jgi:membrane associated rhomboid family serine protease
MPQQTRDSPEITKLLTGITLHADRRYNSPQREAADLGPAGEVHGGMDDQRASPQQSFPEVETLLRVGTPRVWVTPTIAGLLIFCFAGSVLLGAHPMSPTTEQLVRLGASFGPMVADGEWWRLFTASLLHAGLVHLAFNLWAFWSAGFLTERLFGNAAFLGIYLLSAVGAGLASVAVKPFAVSVGASGAIFGVYGALLAFVLAHRGTLPKGFLRQQRSGLLGFLAYNLVYGLVDQRIDMAGHLGGLVTGMAAGWLLQRDLLQPRANTRRRLLAALGVAVLLLFAGRGVLGRVASSPEVRSSALAERAGDALDAHDPAKAIELSTESLAIQQNAWALAIRGIARLRLSRPEDAVTDLRAALKLQDLPFARDSLCQAAANSANGDAAKIETAIADCSAAIDGSKNSALPLGQRAWLRVKQGKSDQALADLKSALVRSPGDGAALQLRAEVYMEQKQLDAAEKDCVSLDGVAKGSYEPTAICAQIAQLRNDRPLAVKRASLILEQRPDHVVALYIRASALFVQGDLEASNADLDHFLQLRPGNPDALNSRAWNRVAGGDFARAREDADRSLAARPHWWAALGTRCFALAGLGERDAARRDCQESVQLRPQNPIDQGMLEFLQGHRAEAVRLWRAAQKERPQESRVLEPWIARASGR